MIARLFRLRLSLFVALVVLCVAPLRASEFHVALNGDDSTTGAANRPFRTLERAHDEVRRTCGDATKHEPITVIIHGGTYELYSTLELTAQDSGTADCPVVWRAADKEEVRITGAAELPADGFLPVKDIHILARLTKDARAQVLQLNLAALHLPVGEEWPVKFAGAPVSPELFFNDKRMTVARWPNVDANGGWATTAKFVETGLRPGDGGYAHQPGSFEYSGDEPDRWNVADGIWLHGYWAYDWNEESIKVASIDRAKKVIKLAAPATYGIHQGNPSPRRFCAVNVLEELDSPGEFYLDRVHEQLYFWPPGDMDRARISLSILDGPLVRMKDAEHVVFRDLIFENTLGDGIEITGGREDSIESCIVRNVRQMGISVSGGAQHRVDNCDITDTGSGGLRLGGGDRKTLTPAKHQATNNHIWNFSRHQLTGAYAIILEGVGNLASQNHIHDAPHQAILINGNDHVIEFNEIDHVVTASDDAGAIYKGRNPSCRGNVIRYNYLHDIGSTMGHGTAAIYFDDGDGGDTVFGNVFVRAGHAGAGPFGTIFSHGGHGIHVENNIFVDGTRALGSYPWDDARWADAIHGGQNCGWTNKLLKEVDITKPPYTTRYPELVGFMDPKPGAARVSWAKNNVLVRCESVSNGNWVAPAESNWVTKDDPGFVDASHWNYALRADSEVVKQLPQFKAIPFEKIGMKR